jgi:hypothetical protein
MMVRVRNYADDFETLKEKRACEIKYQNKKNKD